MILVPVFRKSAFTGSMKFLFLRLTLRRYEPVTTSIIPAIPPGLGNSPTIMGEVMSIKRGVKLSIGIISDMSPFETACI
jgi:hypothetical protein